METLPNVAIVLVNYNNFNQTIQCINSIKKNYYNNYKVIVVDNCSKNDSYMELLKYKDNKVKIIQSRYNGGFSYGNNIGIKYAIKEHYDYVLLLNNDTIVSPNFLKSLLEDIDRGSKIVRTGRIMYYPDCEKIWYAGGTIDWNRLRAIHNGLNCYYNENKEFNNSFNIDFISGCYMLLPINCFLDVGLLDETYFMYFEDVDFCVRLKDAGYKFEYIKDSVIYHCVSSSSGGEMSPFVVEWNSRSRRRFYNNFKNKIPRYKREIVFLICEFRTIIKILVKANRIINLKAYIKSFRKID